MESTWQRAEIAYARGDNRTAAALFLAVEREAQKGIEPEIPELLTARIHALSLDRFAFALGLGSLAIVFTSLVLAVALA